MRLRHILPAMNLVLYGALFLPPFLGHAEQQELAMVRSRGAVIEALQIPERSRPKAIGAVFVGALNAPAFAMASLATVALPAGARTLIFAITAAIFSLLLWYRIGRRLDQRTPDQPRRVASRWRMLFLEIVVVPVLLGLWLIVPFAVIGAIVRLFQSRFEDMLLLLGGAFWCSVAVYMALEAIDWRGRRVPKSV